MTLVLKRAAEVSNLPPSSALAAWGKRKASKHPQSHMKKYIFPSQCGEKPPAFLLCLGVCLRRSSSPKCPFPLLDLFQAQKNTCVQNPVQQTALRLLFLWVVPAYDTAPSLVETGQCDVRKSKRNQRKLEFTRIFTVAKSMSVRTVLAKRAREFQIK